MKGQCFLLFSVLLLIVSCSSFCRVVGENLIQECSSELQKVSDCLGFATGKANVPTKQCCASVTEMKDNDPKCLCFIMQQTHNGSAQVKSLGIQEARLLQLPSACQLHNASLSICPKLLGLSPSSPDAAIFTNATTPATPAASAGTSTTSAPDKSDGIKHGPSFVGLLVYALAISLYAFPSMSGPKF